MEHEVKSIRTLVFASGLARGTLSPRQVSGLVEGLKREEASRPLPKSRKGEHSSAPLIISSPVSVRTHECKQQKQQQLHEVE